MNYADRRLARDDRLERHRVADRDLREHLAVELDRRGAELTDQLRVADAVEPSSRIDALDPQRAEVPLPLLARPVHVQPRVLHGLVRDRMSLAALAAETLRPLEQAVTAATCFESSFCAGHDFVPLRVRQQDVDLVVVRGRHVAGVAELALPLLATAGQEMALERARELELAGGGLFKPLLGTGMSLDLGHGYTAKRV